MPFAVVYDACVLYPSITRDLLIRVAIERMVRAHWSAEILDEVFRNLTVDRPDLDPNALLRTRELMEAALPAAMITGYQPLLQNVPGLAVPRHEATQRSGLLCSSRSNCANRLRDVSAVTKPSHVEPAFAGVLLDWRGTLVVAPADRWLVQSALESLGRGCSDEHIDQVLARLRKADITEVDSSAIDADAALHRRAYFAWFTEAGLDEELAQRLYALESAPALNPFAADVGALLQTLHAAKVRVCIVSDIHVDLRPAFALHKNADGSTWADLVDAWALSYELGVAKPDPVMFTAALQRLDLPAEKALMVGDRHTHDGAAIKLGITTLLLPPLQRSEEFRLQRVVDLVLPGISLSQSESRGEPPANAYRL